MKKIICTMIILLSSFLILVIPVNADVRCEDLEKKTQRVISSNIENYNDGSYLEITISEEEVNSRSTVYNKSGAKTYTKRNANGEITWQFIVNGTFTVNEGVSSYCTNATYSTGTLASGWSLKNGNAYASGNSALGNGTFQHKVLFVVTNTESCEVSLSCDVNGVLY